MYRARASSPLEFPEDVVGQWAIEVRGYGEAAGDKPNGRGSVAGAATGRTSASGCSPLTTRNDSPASTRRMKARDRAECPAR